MFDYTKTQPLRFPNTPLPPPPSRAHCCWSKITPPQRCRGCVYDVCGSLSGSLAADEKQLLRIRRWWDHFQRFSLHSWLPARKYHSELKSTPVDRGLGGGMGRGGGSICSVMNCRTARSNLPRGPAVGEINNSGRPAWASQAMARRCFSAAEAGAASLSEWRQILDRLFVWGRGVNGAQVHQIN